MCFCRAERDFCWFSPNGKRVHRGEHVETATTVVAPIINILLPFLCAQQFWDKIKPILDAYSDQIRNLQKWQRKLFMHGILEWEILSVFSNIRACGPSTAGLARYAVDQCNHYLHFTWRVHILRMWRVTAGTVLRSYVWVVKIEKMAQAHGTKCGMKTPQWTKWVKFDQQHAKRDHHQNQLIHYRLEMAHLLFIYSLLCKS